MAGYDPNPGRNGIVQALMGVNNPAPGGVVTPPFGGIPSMPQQQGFGAGGPPPSGAMGAMGAPGQQPGLSLPGVTAPGALPGAAGPGQLPQAMGGQAMPQGAAPQPLPPRPY